jgi:hypothetical protein
MAQMSYLELFEDLGTDLVGVTVLAVGLYYRRHRRGDLVAAFFSVNFGLFVTMALLSSVRVDLATGFGLFAILSLVHLRSKPSTQEEIAYYFAVLVMGLVNGLRLPERMTTIAFDMALIVGMYVIDNRKFSTRASHVTVTLDAVHESPGALIADLERRLHGRVLDHNVEDVDYVRETTVVDVRYRADNPVGGRPRRRTPPVMDELGSTSGGGSAEPTVAL